MSLKQGLGIGAGIASDMMAASAAKKAAKRQAKYDKEQTALEHAEGRKDTQFQGELGDYYTQLDKQRKRDARGKSFDKYSAIPLPDPELDADGKPKPFRTPLVSAAPKAPEATVIKPTAKLSKKQKKQIAAAETARQLAEINKDTTTPGG